MEIMNDTSWKKLKNNDSRIAGFVRNIDRGSAVQADLWEIYKGLTIAYQLRKKKNQCRDGTSYLTYKESVILLVSFKTLLSCQKLGVSL